MQFFFRNCTHILTRTKRKKFEDMFLVKIASKGTSLTLKLNGHSKNESHNSKQRPALLFAHELNKSYETLIPVVESRG